MEARLIQIGNSRGIRIPRAVLERYRIEEGSILDLEERQDGILIKPQARAEGKIGWEEAYAEMAIEAAESSEWTDWDGLAGDGLDD